MNDETNKVMFENINKQLTTINDKLDKFGMNMDCLKSDFVRHDEQIKMIKEKAQKRDEEREKILVDNANAHSDLIKRIELITKQQYIWAGAFSVIVVVAQIVIAWLSKRL